MPTVADNPPLYFLNILGFESPAAVSAPTRRNDNNGDLFGGDSNHGDRSQNLQLIKIHIEQADDNRALGKKLLEARSCILEISFYFW